MLRYLRQTFHMEPNLLKALLTSALLILTSCSSSAKKFDTLETVNQVDLNKYLGRWYEIATIPQSFQKECEKNSQAMYSMGESNRINVVNSCLRADGSSKISDARAEVVDTKTNSKLNVTFVKIFGWIFTFGGKYWIIDLADDYSYSVVGHPNRNFLWILSRSPQMEPEQIAKIAQKLKTVGYDTCNVRMTIQDNGNSSKSRLCDL